MGTVAGLADDRDVVLNIQDRPDAVADQFLVVDNEGADHSECRLFKGMLAVTEKPEVGPAWAVTVDGDAFAESDQAVAAHGRSSASCSVVDDLSEQRVRSALDLHVDVGGARMLQRVGQRLLYESVRSQANTDRQIGQIILVGADLHAGAAHPVEQVLERAKLRLPRGLRRRLVDPEKGDQVAHLREGLPGSDVGGGECGTGTVRVGG